MSSSAKLTKLLSVRNDSVISTSTSIGPTETRLCFSRMQDDTTLSTLLEAPYQAKLIEYLIVNVHVSFTFLIDV